MEHRRIGAHGPLVSRLALGLGLRGQHDEREAERLIQHALDRGVTFFDCANVYRLGDTRGDSTRSEEILGRVLGTRRDEVVITSKVGNPVGPASQDRGASPSHVRREVERSLRRLGTDRIDIYLLHRYDANVPLSEQVAVLHDLVLEGKVEHVGVCNFDASEVTAFLAAQAACAAAPLVTVQNPYNLLDRALESDMFQFVRERGLGVMAYSPLAIGLLGGQYQPGVAPPPGSYWASRAPAEFAAVMRGAAGATVDATCAIAARMGVRPAAVATAWVLAHPEVTVAISGADDEGQLDSALAAAELELDDADLDLLDRVSTPEGPA